MGEQRKVSTSQVWVKSHKAMSFLLVLAVIAELLHKHIWNLLGSQAGAGHSSWEGESAGAWFEGEDSPAHSQTSMLPRDYKSIISTLIGSAMLPVKQSGAQ